MNIGFGNQKGGVGKTTLTLLFAHYLLDKGEEPLCIDFDIQFSLYSKWVTANAILTEEPAMHVLKCELDEAQEILNVLKTADGIKLFDMPGSLENPNLQHLLEELDIIVCPFLYEPISFESTLIFAQILDKLNIKAKLLFVPNLVKSNVKYQIVENIQEELSAYGTITAPVSDWVDMQRIDFFSIKPKVMENVGKAFDDVYSTLI